MHVEKEKRGNMHMEKRKENHAQGKKERKPCMAVEKEKKRYTEQSRDRMLRNKHRTDYTRENILKKTNSGTVPQEYCWPIGRNHLGRNIWLIPNHWFQWNRSMVVIPVPVSFWTPVDNYSMSLSLCPSGPQWITILDSRQTGRNGSMNS